MAITLTGSVTGSAVTGLTSPTYTLVADQAPEGNNAKQGAVSTIGGTQGGVFAHSISSPFTLTWVKPKTFNATANTPTSRTQYNKHQLISRKGLQCSTAESTFKTGIIRFSYEVPVGAESVDPENVKAQLSATAGWINTHLDEIVASITGGII